ncbi:MAG: dipeptidase PepE [Candidatus Aenigmarchaeota archaeon]|nr:dipeptidase PepE [Candidatus Aenigmarchaeota archaeon]
MAKKLLLVSNSILHGSGYLDHCEGEIRNFLGGAGKILFVPYARPGGITHAEYADVASRRFEKMGYALNSIHEAVNPVFTPKDAVESAGAIFIGGGNTFRLLAGLQGADIMPNIYGRVKEGMPYIGTSAGANVACPTIMTTNDMPIAEVPSLHALGLVPFQINPHYIDADPNSKHMGETRETRIKEYLAFNTIPVVGLREGAMLVLDENGLTLKGSTGARVFRKGEEPGEYSPGDSLDFLL